MNLFVYSDESGVFDAANNDFFVFGGLLFMSKASRDAANRKYHAVERTIRRSGNYALDAELKASVLTRAQRRSVIRSLNNEIKFAVIVEQKKLEPNIFAHKKHKQRFLDYAYKMALKNCLLQLSAEGRLDLPSIEHLFVYCDEHTTATSGIYELEESLLKEFKLGMHSKNFIRFFPPCIPTLKGLTVKFIASETSALIRAADVLANHVYGCAMSKTAPNRPNLYLKYIP